MPFSFQKYVLFFGCLFSLSCDKEELPIWPVEANQHVTADSLQIKNEDEKEEEENLPDETPDHPSIGDPGEENEPNPEEENAEAYPETLLGQEFVIRKGRHDIGFSFASFDKNELNFKVLFDSSAIYKTTLSSNQSSINKLYGFSDCGSFHHQNSARVGWRWYEGRLELLGYVYSNGKRAFQHLAFIDIGKVYQVSIRIDAERYVFKSGTEEISFERACHTGNYKGYKLYPYFGGQEPAPHDVKIIIEEI